MGGIIQDDRRIDLLMKWGAAPCQAIARMGDDRELYEHLLMKIGSSNRFERISQQIREGALYEAYRSVHDLKGASATMGFTPLTDALEKLLRPLMEGRMPESADLRDAEQAWSCLRLICTGSSC